MAKKPSAQLAGFKITPTGDGKGRMSLKDSDGNEWSTDIPYLILIDLARGMPRYINQLARSLSLPNGGDPDVQVTADGVRASGAGVNVTLLGDAVVLQIDDPHGIRTAWLLTPELAESLGQDLRNRGRSLKRGKKARPKH